MCIYMVTIIKRGEAWWWLGTARTGARLADTDVRVIGAHAEGLHEKEVGAWAIS